jgi:cytochrome bd-type quinol oxidase subunit 1
MLTSLVAPFAAMKQKQQQLEVTRMVLQMMLPARVVAMISEHLGWNTNSIGNDSSWWL